MGSEDGLAPSHAMGFTKLSSYFCVGLCGSLSIIGPHKLMGSGIIRRYGCVGLGVALLEEMCHCGGEL